MKKREPHARLLSQRVFLPPPEELRRLLPARPPAARALAPIARAEPPAPRSLKNRISVGPPSAERSKGPSVLRRDDDLTAIPKGTPIQVKLFSQGRSELAGSDVPSTGGTIVYLNAGLRYRSDDGVSLYGFFLVPVYRRVNDALAPRFSVLFGVAKAF